MAHGVYRYGLVPVGPYHGGEVENAESGRLQWYWPAGGGGVGDGGFSFRKSMRNRNLA